jgi:sarcosine oxidase gamma subunit
MENGCMAELVALHPDPRPLPGVERLDLGVLSLRRLRRFGPDLPAVAPLPADTPVGQAARAEGLLLAAPAPSEWLVLGDQRAVAPLARAQDPGAFLAVDITEACAAFRLAPGTAAEALAGYSPIDPAMLTPGSATRTQFAELTVLLVPEPDGTYLLIAEAAAADHLIALLALLATDP